MAKESKPEKEAKTRSQKYGTVVAGCACVHRFQDKQYGPGRRLHNLSAGGAKRRCTVCGKESGL